MHGVARLPELVREGVDARGQAKCVVEQEYLGHLVLLRPRVVRGARRLRLEAQPEVARQSAVSDEESGSTTAFAGRWSPWPCSDSV